MLKLHEPEVVFCESPKAALRYLNEYVEATEAIEPPEPVDFSSAEGFSAFPKFLLKAYLQNVKQAKKRKHSGAKSIYSLMQKTSDKSRQLLIKHIDRCIPKKVSLRDAMFYSFQSAQPMFQAGEKLIEDQGNAVPPVPDFKELFDNLPAESEQQLEAFEQFLTWLPPKNWLLRWWIKLWVMSSLLGKISNSMVGTGQYHQTLLSTFSEAEKQFLEQNPAITTPELADLCILLDFGFSELDYPPQEKLWAALQGLTKYCGWIFAVENLCVVCDRPTSIKLNDNGLLHNPDGEPAIEYSDGLKLYAYHGIILPEKYGAVPSNDWQAQWVIDESNTKLQTLLMKEIGAVRLSQELAVEEIKTAEDYILLKLTDVKPVATYILRRRDPSTGELYAVRISHRPKSMVSAVDFARRQGNEENFPLLEVPLTNEAV